MLIVMVRLPTIETRAEEDDGRNVGQEEYHGVCMEVE